MITIIISMHLHSSIIFPVVKMFSVDEFQLQNNNIYTFSLNALRYMYIKYYQDLLCRWWLYHYQKYMIIACLIYKACSSHPW